MRRERERVAALKLQAEEEERRLRKERERPKVAVGPGTPHEIGTGLDAMVLVPAGKFIRGSTPQQAEAAYPKSKEIWQGVKKEWFDREVPQRRIYLDAFYIDKYPVANSQFGKFGKPKKDYGRRFKNKRQPVVGVTWYQARDYCRFVGKRLPTEAEWEKTARGVNGRKYPWGGQWDPTKVIWNKNSGGKTHPVDRTSNTHRSPYGAVDISGNVWSGWGTGSRRIITRPPRLATRKSLPPVASAWFDSDPTGFRAALRDRDRPGNGYDNLGFRCAKAP